MDLFEILWTVLGAVLPVLVIGIAPLTAIPLALISLVLFKNKK